MKILLFFSSLSSIYSIILSGILIYWFFIRKTSYYIGENGKKIQIDWSSISKDITLPKVKELYVHTTSLPDNKFIIHYILNNGDSKNVLVKKNKTFYNKRENIKKQELYINFDDASNQLRIQNVNIYKVL